MTGHDTGGDRGGGGALTGAMVIGAARVHGTHGTVHGVDPCTGERLSPAFGLGGAAEAARAAALAADAFPAYRATAPHARAAFLQDIAAEIEAISAALVERVVRETGIVRARVQGELARTTGQLRLFADLVRAGHWAGARIAPALPDRTPLLRTVLGALEGQLTATVHAADDDREPAAPLLELLEDKVGRIVFNGWPTGVDVGHAMVHGGPYPATSDGRSTSVGTLAIDRFLRPVACQNVPAELLPAPVDEPHSLGLWRQVDGDLTRD